MCLCLRLCLYLLWVCRYRSPEYDARILRDAMEGIGTDETQMSEVLCTRIDSELQLIQKKYEEIYSRNLQDDIKSETGGDLESCYIQLLSGNTRVSRKDSDLKNDVKALYKAGEGKWGTNEKKFIQLLATCSRYKLS